MISSPHFLQRGGGSLIFWTLLWPTVLREAEVSQGPWSKLGQQLSHREGIWLCRAAAVTGDNKYAQLVLNVALQI